jgi:bacteriorhodopsin
MSTYITSDKNIPVPTISSGIPLIPKPPENPPTTGIGATSTKEKIESKINPVQYYVKASFMITYILLLTTATVTFIEAMTTKVEAVRHVLNLETCVSIVAGYFYSIFVTQIEGYSKEGKEVDWSDITKTRYVDWTITTPLMILILCIVFGSNIGVKIGLRALALLIVLDISMLAFGYMGEVNILSRGVATVLGFIPFSIMFYLIYSWFIAPKYVFANVALFSIYLILWALYGVVYLLPETYKNITMNVFDCFAKCFVGIGLWLYYSKTVAIY